MIHPDKLTRIEAAAALGVTPKTLANWEKQGRIPVPQRDHRGWRLYDYGTLAQIRRSLLGDDEQSQPSLEIPGLELSARNRFVGIVSEINGDTVLCEVVLKLEDGNEVSAVITRGSVRRLGLRIGDRATAIVKATDVMIAR